MVIFGILEGSCRQQLPMPDSEKAKLERLVCSLRGGIISEREQNSPPRATLGHPAKPISRKEAPEERSELLSGLSRPPSLQNCSLQKCRAQPGVFSREPDRLALGAWSDPHSQEPPNELLTQPAREGGGGPGRRHRCPPPPTCAHTPTYTHPTCTQPHVCTHIYIQYMVSHGYRDLHTHTHTHRCMETYPQRPCVSTLSTPLLNHLFSNVLSHGYSHACQIQRPEGRCRPQDHVQTPCVTPAHTHTSLERGPGLWAAWPEE